MRGHLSSQMHLRRESLLSLPHILMYASARVIGELLDRDTMQILSVHSSPAIRIEYLVTPGDGFMAPAAGLNPGDLLFWGVLFVSPVCSRTPAAQQRYQSTVYPDG